MVFCNDHGAAVWPSLTERKAKLLVGEVVAYLASVEESFFSADESSASILAAPGVQSAHRACTRGMGHPSQWLEMMRMMCNDVCIIYIYIYTIIRCKL